MSTLNATPREVTETVWNGMKAAKAVLPNTPYRVHLWPTVAMYAWSEDGENAYYYTSLEELLNNHLKENN